MYEHEKEWKRTDNVGWHSQSEIVSIWFPDIKVQLGKAMDAYLSGRNLDPLLARRQGWYPAWYNGPRIIVPCVRTDPYNFWQGRLIELDDWQYVRGDFKRWDSPKGPRGDAICYLAGPDGPTSRTLAVVEGPMDALAARMVGADAAAILGLMPPAGVFLHLSTIARSYEQVVLIGDLGINETALWTKIHNGLTKYGTLSRLKFPVGIKDLAEANDDYRKDLVFG